MRWTAAACVMMLACSAEGPEQPKRGPDVSAIPAGKGWECFRDSVGGYSLCFRVGQCEPARVVLRDEYDRRALSYSLSPCTARPGASCLTAKPTTAPSAIALCFEMSSECEESRDYYASRPADYTHVSERCGTYP